MYVYISLLRIGFYLDLVFPWEKTLLFPLLFDPEIDLLAAILAAISFLAAANATEALLAAPTLLTASAWELLAIAAWTPIIVSYLPF